MSINCKHEECKYSFECTLNTLTPAQVREFILATHRKYYEIEGSLWNTMTSHAIWMRAVEAVVPDPEWRDVVALCAMAACYYGFDYLIEEKANG
jgi:hypothetical protein